VHPNALVPTQLPVRLSEPPKPVLAKTPPEVTSPIIFVIKRASLQVPVTVLQVKGLANKDPPLEMVKVKGTAGSAAGWTMVISLPEGLAKLKTVVFAAFAWPDPK